MEARKFSMAAQDLDEIEDLQADHSALATMLRARRTVSTEGMSMGVRTLWTVYLNILEEAIKILDSLIQLMKSP